MRVLKEGFRHVADNFRPSTGSSNGKGLEGFGQPGTTVFTNNSNGLSSVGIRMAGEVFFLLNFCIVEIGNESFQFLNVVNEAISSGL